MRELRGDERVQLEEEKMKFLHFDAWTETGDVIRVDLEGSEANVLVLDDSNFNSYRHGSPLQLYYGGHYRQSPVFITPPSTGPWHVVVDLGGGAGSVRAQVRVLQGATN